MFRNYLSGPLDTSGKNQRAERARGFSRFRNPLCYHLLLGFPSGFSALGCVIRCSRCADLVCSALNGINYL